MPSGTCVRLAIVAAVFFLAAVLLVRELPFIGFTVPASRGHSTPTTDSKDASTGTEKPNDPVAKPAEVVYATTSIIAPVASHRATEVNGSPAMPTSGSVPGAKPSTKTVAKLEAGQTLSPFRLVSPNGRYELRLLDSGSLSLVDTKTDIERFTSDTEYHWPVTWQVELTQEGVLMLSWANETAAPYGATPWVSSLLPGCASVDNVDEKPVLELLDSGKLHIRAGSKTTCLLHRAADDMGRLAIVYTGFLRTYLKTCKEQNNKLVKTWTGSGGVDIHVFTYFEDVYHDSSDSVDKDSIAKHLKSCFGDALKTVEVKKLDEVRESAENPPEVLAKECGKNKLNHQLSQWKALYLASQQVQAYMMKEGVSYDYIYKGRLDLLYWGDSPALSSLKVPENGILAPRVTLDWTWYAMLHDGELRAGVTDITAFGRPNAMFTYLALYREFIHTRTLEKGTAKWKGFNTKTREKNPEGQEGCTPEGILAYWLRINGIAVKTDWRFKMGLLRGDGKVIFTCPEGRGWLCPGFVPQVHDDGTLF